MITHRGLPTLRSLSNPGEGFENIAITSTRKFQVRESLVWDVSRYSMGRPTQGDPLPWRWASHEAKAAYRTWWSRRTVAAFGTEGLRQTGGSASTIGAFGD